MSEGKTVRKWFEEHNDQNVMKAFKTGNFVVAYNVTENDEFNTVANDGAGNPLFLKRIEGETRDEILDFVVPAGSKVNLIPKPIWSKMTEQNMFVARDNPNIDYLPNGNLRAKTSDYGEKPLELDVDSL